MKLTPALFGLLAFAATIEAIPSPRDTKPTSGAGSDASIANLKDKIKNVVVLVMENRSVDNLLGGQKIKGLDNPINNGPFCNPINITDPSLGQACSTPRNFDSILNDPGHAVYGNNFEFYGTFSPNNTAIQSGELKPIMKGFVQEHLRTYGTKANASDLAVQVMNYYTEEQVPVLTAMTKQFVTFNSWFSGHPGVS